jgi:hypothetical protein
MIFLGYAGIRKTRHTSRSIVLRCNLEFCDILCEENEINLYIYIYIYMKIMDIAIRSAHDLSPDTIQNSTFCCPFSVLSCILFQNSVLMNTMNGIQTLGAQDT